MIHVGGFLTQIKSEGLGFKILDPFELPPDYDQTIVEEEEIASVEEAQETDFGEEEGLDEEDESTPSSEDPLLDFLQKRKKARLEFSPRYSPKAMAFKAYQRQIDSIVVVEKKMQFFIDQAA